MVKARKIPNMAAAEKKRVGRRVELVLKMISGGVPNHTESTTEERSLKVRKKIPNQSANYMNSTVILLSQTLRPTRLPNINQ